MKYIFQISNCVKVTLTDNSIVHKILHREEKMVQEVIATDSSEITCYILFDITMRKVKQANFFVESFYLCTVLGNPNLFSSENLAPYTNCCLQYVPLNTFFKIMNLADYN